MWIGVLWAGPRVAMWITHVGGKFFRHGLLEKSLKYSPKISHQIFTTFFTMQFMISKEICHPVLTPGAISCKDSLGTHIFSRRRANHEVQTVN